MIKSISSVNNELVKQVAALKQKKQRKETQSFVVEGVRSVEEVVNSSWELLQFFFIADGMSLREQEILDAANNRGVDCYAVTEPVMAKLAATETPQHLAAVVACQEESNPLASAQQGFILVLDGISDPGNLGTLVRSADAAGAAGVVLLENCADLYSPKVVRSTMGSLFHLPVLQLTSYELLEHCRHYAWPLWVSMLEGGTSLYELQWPAKAAVVIGSEATGVQSAVAEAASQKVFIPMPGRAESLNAAVAGGILAFACAHAQAVAQ